MNLLFVHNNFPGQFSHIVGHLERKGLHRLAAIGSQTARAMPGVRLQRYRFDVRDLNGTHPFARSFDLQCRRGEQVLYAATSLLASGFVPDVVVVHSGWGENLPLRVAFPRARIIVYCEYYYRPFGQDVNFDPEFDEMSMDGMTLLGARNANSLLALTEADDGLSPTQWQRSTYPKLLQSKISVLHEGIDSNRVRPDPTATVQLPTGRRLGRSDQVLTYVSRNLEPLRGYHMFMRALPLIMKKCKEAEILIVGGSGVSYGAAPKQGSWKDIFLDEVREQVDVERIHFLGNVDYDNYLKLLQVSSVHAYFTYPFVLSWSLLEAMSAGCRLIVSDTAPVQEVLDDSSAILVPFSDSHAFALAAIECLQNPVAYQPLREKARAIIESKFDLAGKVLPDVERFLIEG